MARAGDNLTLFLAGSVIHKKHSTRKGILFKSHRYLFYCHFPLMVIATDKMTGALLFVYTDQPAI